MRNTSSVTADEVVQVHLQFPQRVSIRPGWTRRVRLTLGPRDLSMLNEEGNRLVATGAYRLFVGDEQPGAGAAGTGLSPAIPGEQKLPR